MPVARLAVAPQNAPARPRPTVTQRNIRSRKRAQLEVLRKRGEVKQQELQARAQVAAVITGEEIARARGRAQAAVSRQQGLYRARENERFRQSIISLPGTIGSTAAPGLGSNLMLVISVMAGLIIFYLLVSKSEQTSGYLRGLGIALRKLSSIEPLFEKVSTEEA